MIYNNDSNVKIKCIIICFYIFISICVKGNNAFIHNFFPGILVRSNNTDNVYLTFPKLLFDYSSPFPEAHSYCEDASDQYPWKPKDDVFFEAGQKKEYSFECKIIKPIDIKKMFQSNLLFNVSGFSGKTPTYCLLHVDKTKLDYFYGYKITIPASPIGFSDIYFDVKFCTATALYSKEKVMYGSTFKQVLVLDVSPSFLASSVYLFLGMAVFSLVLSCLIISAIIHRWKTSISSKVDYINIDNDEEGYRNNDDIEMKSITCDISYKTNEEKIQYYINKIDSFFNVHELRSSSLSIGTYEDCSNDLGIYNSNNSLNNQNSNQLNNNNNNNDNNNHNINNNNNNNSFYNNNNNNNNNHDLNNRENKNNKIEYQCYSPTYHHNHYNEYILNSNVNLNSSGSNGGRLLNGSFNYNYSFNNDNNNYYNRSNNNQNYYNNKNNNNTNNNINNI